jgi:Domain of unknown function (DUF4214)
MKKWLLCAAALMALSLFTAQTARAQYVYGISAVGYNSSARYVYGYSDTYVDWSTGYYYDPAVQGELYWQYDNEVPLDAGYDEGYSDPYDGILIPAQVDTFSALYLPDTLYSEYGNHFVRPYYYYSYCYGFYEGCYADPYGFSYYDGFGDAGGSYGFPGFFFDPYYRVSGRLYFLGSTGVSIKTPNEDSCKYSATFFDESTGSDVSCPTPTPTPTPDVFQVKWHSPTNPPAVPVKGSLPHPGAGMPPYVNTVVLTADLTAGTPTGGTFSWTTSSDKITLTNVQSTSSTSQVTVTGITKSDKQLDVQINLSYQLGDRSSQATINLTVQQPSFFGITGPQDITFNGPRNCPPTKQGRAQAGWQKNITWQLEDQFGDPMTFALPTYDTLTNSPNNCFNPRKGEGTDPSPDATTGPGGKWDHEYGQCSTSCASGSRTCEVKGVQKYFVNGFEIDKNYTMRCNAIFVAGDGSTPDPTPPRPRVVIDFIDGLWVGALQHQPDQATLDSWANSLISADAQGGDQRLAQARTLARAVFTSSEYAALNRSDEDFVTDLYAAYLGRDPDEGGYNSWLAALHDDEANGRDGREHLIQGFEYSTEFANVVASIEMTTEPTCDPVQEQSCYDSGGTWDSGSCLCTIPPDPCLRKPWLCDQYY